VRGVLYGQVLLAPLGIHMGWCAEGRFTELQCAGPIEVLCVGIRSLAQGIRHAAAHRSMPCGMYHHASWQCYSGLCA
jgi:hypothetical protein